MPYPRGEALGDMAGRKTEKRLNSPLLIPEEAFENFSRPVSWLGASDFSGPSRFFNSDTRKTSPLTVAGPRRIHTGFPNTLSYGVIDTLPPSACQRKTNSSYRLHRKFLKGTQRGPPWWGRESNIRPPSRNRGGYSLPRLKKGASPRLFGLPR